MEKGCEEVMKGKEGQVLEIDIEMKSAKEKMEKVDTDATRTLVTLLKKKYNFTVRTFKCEERGATKKYFAGLIKDSVQWILL